MKLKKTKTPVKNQPDRSWIVLILFLTMLISACFSYISSVILEDIGLFVGFLVLLLIILIGIAFDIIGVAVTAADAVPFHAMASRKVPEAQEALRLIKNANRVCSFCNDVIGDICGVVSGSASAVIAIRILALHPGLRELVLNLVLSALVAALTVGGKACGKTVAIQKANDVLRLTARVTLFFRNLFR